MANDVYFQGGAAGPGSPAVSPNTPSAPVSTPNEAKQEVSGNEPVTKAELEKLRLEIEEQVLRKAQSLTDKLGSKLDVRIKTAQEEAAKAIRIMKASGVTISPEQERATIQTAVNDALVSAEETHVNQVQAEQPRNPDLFVDKEVHRIMRETGVYLDPDEANALIGEVDSPYSYIKQFERICSERSTKPPAQSRVPTLAQGGKPSDVSVIEQQYRNEMALIIEGKHPTIRRGNAQAVTALKAEYRKKGLNVY